MGYYKYLNDLLRPFGVYNASGKYSDSELYSLGDALDGEFSLCDKMEKECVLQTAEDWGLKLYEELFLKTPVTDDIAQRRSAVMSLLCVNDASFSLDELNKTVSGCGIKAQVSEGEDKYTVYVSFPGKNGSPVGFSEIEGRLKEILPCHLNIEYVYTYPMWDEIELAFNTWDEISGKTWDELERFGSEQ